jgi:hypothetical protein
VGGEGPVGPAGPKAKWAGKVSRAKSNEEGFLNKNCLFEFTKGLEICTRRFRRDFDMRIFAKFFFAPQVF